RKRRPEPVPPGTRIAVDESVPGQRRENAVRGALVDAQEAGEGGQACVAPAVPQRQEDPGRPIDGGHRSRTGRERGGRPFSLLNSRSPDRTAIDRGYPN